METRLRLKPGQNGTKGLHRKYGDRLICVRYVYDQEKRRRYKTVELIEETVPWHPKTVRERRFIDTPPDEPKLVLIGYAEKELQKRVKERGGRWNPAEQAWKMRYADIEQLGLVGRILDPTPP